MNCIRKSWFSELSEEWPGQSFSLEVEEIYFHKKSKFQEILVFASKSHGNVLVLDGVIQCTDRDEFVYHEMLTHLALCSHPNPEKVLIVGGGDGGVAREVIKHDHVESITLCEIDQMVIEVAEKYFPNLSKVFQHPKVTINIGDGSKFIKTYEEAFDVILTDSSEPNIGPSAPLYTKDYYEAVKKALKSDGLLCSLGDSIWLDLKLIKKMQDFCKLLFPVVQYATTTVPTYPSGQIGFLLCSKNPCTNFKEPLIHSEKQLKEMGMKYYNYEVHKGSFALPQFVKEALLK